jgi:large repetitive protein
MAGRKRIPILEREQRADRSCLWVERLPGPFVNLSRLKYGDKIIVHAYGQTFMYEVRANVVVEPNDTSIFRHEEKSWLTLVTCKEYDEKTNSYRKRVVVRAVLISVSGK